MCVCVCVCVCVCCLRSAGEGDGSDGEVERLKTRVRKAGDHARVSIQITVSSHVCIPFSSVSRSTCVPYMENYFKNTGSCNV